MAGKFKVSAMCRHIPFHDEADTTEGDLASWAETYLSMTPDEQAHETADIRRAINLANMKREQAGATTKVNRPNIVPQMDIEIAE